MASNAPIAGYVVKIKQTGARFLIEEAVSLQAACNAIAMARATGSVGWEDSESHVDATTGERSRERIRARVYRIHSNGCKVTPN